MAGEVWLNSTGKRILNDDGKLILCDECPCIDCGGCPFSPPSAIEITIDVPTCTGFCVPRPGGSGQSKTVTIKSGESINGTYTIPFDPDNSSSTMCRYVALFGPSDFFTVQNWIGNTTCSGTPSGTNTYQLGVEIIISKNIFSDPIDYFLSVFVSGGNDPFGQSTSNLIPLVFTYSETSVDIVCCGTKLGITNGGTNENVCSQYTFSGRINTNCTLAGCDGIVDLDFINTCPEE